MSDADEREAFGTIVPSRRYTVAEIDLMRKWTESIVRRSAVTYRSIDLAAEVEWRLRTYLMAGVEPEEVRRAGLEAAEREMEFHRSMFEPAPGGK